MTHFVVVTWTDTPATSTHLVQATTDVPVELSLKLAPSAPTPTPKYLTFSGVTYQCGLTWTWPPSQCYPQNESGATTTHTWTIPTPIPNASYTVALLECADCAFPCPSTPPIPLTPNAAGQLLLVGNVQATDGTHNLGLWTPTGAPLTRLPWPGNSFNSPQAESVSPDGRYLYMTNGIDAVCRYDLTAGFALTQLPVNNPRLPTNAVARSDNSYICNHVALGDPPFSPLSCNYYDATGAFIQVIPVAIIDPIGSGTDWMWLAADNTTFYALEDTEPGIPTALHVTDLDTMTILPDWIALTDEQTQGFTGLPDGGMAIAQGGILTRYNADTTVRWTFTLPLGVANPSTAPNGLSIWCVTRFNMAPPDEPHVFQLDADTGTILQDLDLYTTFPDYSFTGPLEFNYPP